jgi:type IV pilus assembly protein PilA
MNKKRLNKNGFSLIELLVVVAIIGILAAAGVVAYNGFIENAKVSSTKANHANIVKFLGSKFTSCSTGNTEIKWKINATSERGYACTYQAAQIASIIVNHFKYDNFKNPYDTTRDAVVRTSSSRPNIGYTNFNCSANTCTVYTQVGPTTSTNTILSSTVVKE